MNAVSPQSETDSGLAYLPVFFGMRGRTALLIGGAAALPKLTLLRRAGARVRLVAQQADDSMVDAIAGDRMVVRTQRASGRASLRRCRRGDRRFGRRGDQSPLGIACPGRRRADQCRGPARFVRLHPARHPRPLAGGDRDLDRRTCSRPGPPHPAAAGDGDPSRLRPDRRAGGKRSAPRVRPPPIAATARRFLGRSARWTGNASRHGGTFGRCRRRRARR